MDNMVLFWKELILAEVWVISNQTLTSMKNLVNHFKVLFYVLLQIKEQLEENIFF